MEVLEGAVVQVEGRCVSSVTVHRVECVEIEQNLVSLPIMLDALGIDIVASLIFKN